MERDFPYDVIEAQESLEDVVTMCSEAIFAALNDVGDKLEVLISLTRDRW